MEMQWYKRPGSASSSRSREPTSPDRSGKPTASSGRSGERASSTAAHREDRVGKVWRRRTAAASSSPSREQTSPDRSERASSAAASMLRQRRRIERGGGSPSSGEETASRWKKQRPVKRWIPRKLLHEYGGNVTAALMAYDEEERASRSSSHSGDAPEEAPFDREERNLLLKMVKKPKPCSGDPEKIAHDEEEDGYSDRKPLIVVEDEQSDKIVGHPTDEDHKQEQGSARGNVLDLLNMDRETLCAKIMELKELLNYVPPLCDYTLELNCDQIIELHKQLALYRIRAYELTENRKLVKLDDVDLESEYPLSRLSENNFFRHYEESFEWYFDSELCWHTRFDNYQRLALRYDKHLNYHYYRSIRNTYEEDLAYVHYFEALANKTKWIEDYLGDNTIERDIIEGVGIMQSVETAAGFPNVSPLLVSHCFSEYFSSIWYDYSDKRISVIYFEIWKLLAKGKSFKEAVSEVRELENAQNLNLNEDHYDVHVAGVDKMASDDEACQSIREAIIRMAPKPKYYIDYARKKVEIANKIGL